MPDQTVSTATDSRAYQLTGVVSNISVRTSRTGTSYFHAQFAFTPKDGKLQTRVAMGFGKAYESVKHLLVEGATVTLAGVFRTEPGVGQTIRVIGLPLPRKVAAAA